MTASLPVPHGADPEEPDRPVERAESRAIVELLSASRETSADAAAPASTAGADVKKSGKTGAKKKRTARAPRRNVTKTDPGPPPPLPPEFAIPVPSEIIVPPKPPLPPVAEVAEVAPDPATFDAPSASAAVVESPVVSDVDEPAVIDEPVVIEEASVVEEPAVLEESAVVEDPAGLEESAVVEEAVAADPAVLDEPPIVDEPAAAVAVTEPDTAVIHSDVAVADAELVASFVDPDVASDAIADARPAALVLRGVTKSFGATRAVEGIDLTVPAGTFYGLVGPNGAGKTTTLSMIAGLLHPDRGAIRVGDVDAIADPLGAKRLMGVLPDRLRTFDRLTGRQLLYYYGVLRGLPAATVESRTADLARAFDLTEALGRAVSDYSAGMAKKVMLAGAMIHSPRLLVLDEPFEAVDPVSSAVILDILSAYVAHGGTVILSSHGMELVERVCSRVAVLVAGQVLAEGAIAEVRGELTLEQRFVELAGGLSDVEGLEWLHTFSD